MRLVSSIPLPPVGVGETGGRQSSAAVVMTAAGLLWSLWSMQMEWARGKGEERGRRTGRATAARPLRTWQASRAELGGGNEGDRTGQKDLLSWRREEGLAFGCTTRWWSSWRGHFHTSGACASQITAVLCAGRQSLVALSRITVCKTGQCDVREMQA